MNSILRATHDEWPKEEQRGLLDDGHSHSSSSPGSASAVAPTICQFPGLWLITLSSAIASPHGPHGRRDDAKEHTFGIVPAVACSDTSRASTSSRKHSLEEPLDGSPRPKRRFVAEMVGATASFPSSAPCAQISVDGPGRRGGLLKRSSAPIQALFSLVASLRTLDYRILCSRVGSRG